MVFQHFSLFETLTVAENIALALGRALRPARRSPRASREVSQRYGLPVDPQRLVHSLSVGERQRVEIVRCLLQEPQLLIMDEPTSVLTPQAVAQLFETLRRLAAEGCSILYISHKLDEIRELCDTRDGAARRPGQSARRCRAQRSAAQPGAHDDRRASSAGLRAPAHAPRPRRALELRDLSLHAADPFGTALHGISPRGARRRDPRHRRRLRQRPEGAAGGALRRDGCATPADACGSTARAVGRLGGRRARALGLRFVPEERLGRGAVPRDDPGRQRAADRRIGRAWCATA